MQSDIGRKVRDLRNRRGLSQDDLAERAGITSRTIQRIETGAVQPLGETIRRVAHALDVDVEELTAVNGPSVRGRRRLVLLHLSPLSGLLIPFAQILAPLSMWLVYRAEDDAIGGQIRDILLFHAVTSILVIAGLLMVAFSWSAGYFLVGGTVLACTGLTLWNAYSISERGSYRYFPPVARAAGAGES